MDFTDPSNKWYMEAARVLVGGNDTGSTLNEELNNIRLPLDDGTYELCGPSINGNPEGLAEHVLIPHGKEILEFEFLDKDDAWNEVKQYLSIHDIEGIVWWHKKDDKKAKIKAIDFNLKRAARDLVHQSD